MDNWDYMNDSDIHNLPFDAGMSPSVPSPHSSCYKTTGDLLDNLNDPVFSKSNTSLLSSTSRTPQTLDVSVSGSFDLNITEEFPFPEDFLASEITVQPLTERNNCFGGHCAEEEKEHFVSNTVDQLSDCDSALLSFAGNEMSLLPAPPSHLSPGSKENFYEDMSSCMPSDRLNEPFSNSFIPTSTPPEPVLSVKRCTKIMANKIFSEPNYRGLGESGFDSRKNGQQIIEPAVVIRKVSRNSRLRGTATKSLIKNADIDQKNVIHQMLNKKHDLKKDPIASKASLAKALGDHLYTLNARSKSLPELQLETAGLKSLDGSPSFLEAFLLCPSKLNPNLGSDELLNSEVVLKSIPEIRSVVGGEKKRLTSWNKQMLKMRESQTDDSISYINANTLGVSVNSREFVAGNSRSIDMGADSFSAFPADVANLEIHKPLLGVDTLFFENDIDALDIEWTHFDSHGSNPHYSGNRPTDNGMMMEHKDWFQEEQRQEDEYWKSYLNVV